MEHKPFSQSEQAVFDQIRKETALSADRMEALRHRILRQAEASQPSFSAAVVSDDRTQRSGLLVISQFAAAAACICIAAFGCIMLLHRFRPTVSGESSQDSVPVIVPDFTVQTETAASETTATAPEQTEDTSQTPSADTTVAETTSAVILTASELQTAEETTSGAVLLTPESSLTTPTAEMTTAEQPQETETVPHSSDSLSLITPDLTGKAGEQICIAVSQTPAAAYAGLQCVFRLSAEGGDVPELQCTSEALPSATIHTARDGSDVLIYLVWSSASGKNVSFGSSDTLLSIVFTVPEDTVTGTVYTLRLDADSGNLYAAEDNRKGEPISSRFGSIRVIP